MEVYPKDLEASIEAFKKFPGVGDKSAERMALALLDMPLEDVELLSQSFINAKKLQLRLLNL